LHQQQVVSEPANSSVMHLHRSVSVGALYATSGEVFIHPCGVWASPTPLVEPRHVFYASTRAQATLYAIICKTTCNIDLAVVKINHSSRESV
jgi:hypothetical protein